MRRARRTSSISVLGPAFLALVLCIAVVGTASARYASLVIDADSGRVLHAANGDTRNHPASLTKMMTLYMVFEAMEKGRINLKTRFRVSARAARQPASRLGVGVGTTMTVEQVILALAVKSANDVAVVAAEGLAGDEKNFARRMTARSRELGMSRTTFRNASGLPHSGQLSTARDMATLARALQRDFPQYYDYFSVADFRFRGYRHRSHNKLLKTYSGTDGIKTGYIRASGFNLVASVRRGDRRLIGVVFGGRSSRSRDRHMVSLLDKGFRALAIGLLAGVTPPRPARREGGEPVVNDVASAAVEVRAVEVHGEGDAEEEATPVPIGSAWGIQVGAYVTPRPARIMAHKAVAHAPDLLDDGVVKVVPLTQRSGRTLYRARVLGLSKSEAYRACRLLKRRRINCMELRVTNPMQLAHAVP